MNPQLPELARQAQQKAMEVAMAIERKDTRTARDALQRLEEIARFTRHVIDSGR
jgi:hypothetical protein